MVRMEKAQSLCAVSTKTTVDAMKNLDFPVELKNSVQDGQSFLKILRDSSIVDRCVHARVLQMQWEAAPNAAEKHDPAVTEFIRKCEEVLATVRKCLPEALQGIEAALRLDKFDEGILPLILNGVAIRNLCRLMKSLKASDHWQVWRVV